jgi:hypothetical protein
MFVIAAKDNMRALQAQLRIARLLDGRGYRNELPVLAPSWLNLPCALKAGFGNGKRTSGHRPLCRATGAAVRPLVSYHARHRTTRTRGGR